MAGRTLILSDLHLGRPGAPADPVDALAALWDDVDHVVFNGDIAEIHHPRFWTDAARQLLQLIDRCDADGVDSSILSGNHDPNLSDRRHLFLAGGRVLVTHGDAMHPAIAPWSPAAGRMREAHRDAEAAIPPEVRGQLESRLRMSQQAAYAEWADEAAIGREAARSSVLAMLLRPWSFLQVLAYWHVFPKLAAEFLAEHAPGGRFIVTGHTHRPGWWRIGSRVVINTGSFSTPCRPRAVLLDDDAISLHRIHLDGDRWRRIEKPLAQWSLDPDSGEADADAGGSSRPIPSPSRGRDSSPSATSGD